MLKVCPPKYTCCKGRGANDKTPYGRLPDQLELTISKFIVGFCTYYNGGNCNKPPSKSDEGGDGICFFSQGRPMYSSQNEASEALMERYKKLQKIADEA